MLSWRVAGQVATTTVGILSAFETPTRSVAPRARERTHAPWHTVLLATRGLGSREIPSRRGVTQ